MKSYLLIQNDIIQDTLELEQLGLNQEEIEGYFEFFFNEYFPDTKEIILN